MFNTLLKTAALATLVNCQGTAEIDDYSYLSWDYDANTDEVVFTSTQPDGTWFGILLGSTGMFQTDAMVFKADGDASQAQDYYSNGYFPPSYDSEQNIKSQILRNEDGRVTIEARRPLQTSDDRDYVITLDQEFPIGFAYNS